MDALPTDISTEAQPTGMACPDCAGVLQVRAAGRRGFLKFECRIRHTYDLGELLAAKEEQLELRSWSYVVGLEELVALLHDIMMVSDDRHLESVVARQACADRRALAQNHVLALRAIIDANRPLTLVEPQTDQPMSDDQR